MTEFDQTIPPSRRLFRRRFSATRLAEAMFGGLAKGNLAVVAIGAVLAGVVAYHALR